MPGTGTKPKSRYTTYSTTGLPGSKKAPKPDAPRLTGSKGSKGPPRRIHITVRRRRPG